jgi:chaperonin GroEL
MNDVVFNAHNDILKGVDKLANAVQATLGPSGKNVIISKKRGSPLITKDGVTVAKNISLKNELENIGAAMVKEVASQSNKLAGDGTTTATVLARSIYKEGLKYIVSGHNPIDLKRDLDTQLEKIINKVKENSLKVESYDDIYKVALVSTNNDARLSDIIARAVQKVGRLGSISVEDSKTDECEVRFVDGLQIERGLLSKYFCNDITRMRIVYENPKILICNYELDNLMSLKNILEDSIKKNYPLIIFAHDFEDNLLAALLANKVKAGLKVACIQTPGSGDYQIDYILDLANATGSYVFEKDHGEELGGVFNPSLLGTCEKIISTITETSIISNNDISEHLKSLEDQIANCDNKLLKDKLKDRYARLTSGIAVIGLTAKTETELKDIKLRVEDAVNATKASVEEGILPGGGIALFRCIANDPKTDAEKIMSLSLQAPIKAILENAGIDFQTVLQSIKSNENYWHGFDARKKEYGDMRSLGIIDPLKVVRSSLQNAVSVAGMLLTTDCCIIKEEEEEKK